MKIITAIALVGLVVSTANADSVDNAITVFLRGDYKEAVKILQPLAEQGNVSPQFNLGFIYSDAPGVPRDYAEAEKWYRNAGDQGNADTQNNLGFMYYIGQGVTQDYVQVHMWFNLASARYSEKGHRDQASKSRDSVAQRMTAAQIAEAQKLASECKQ
jgi:TPR repeat protein